eukprot:493543_1
MELNFEEESESKLGSNTRTDDNNTNGKGKSKATNDQGQGSQGQDSQSQGQDSQGQGRGLLGEVAMTMGMELRRAYVNSITVLHNGTLVSGLDDGHVHLWRRGALIQDLIHCQYQGPNAGG